VKPQEQGRLADAPKKAVPEFELLQPEEDLPL